MTPAVPVLYIGGSGRSGSTVLSRYLAARVGAISVGELRYVWSRGMTANHLCGCGSPFRDCAFWAAVLHRAYGPDASTRVADTAGDIDRIRYIPALVVPGLRRRRVRAAHAEQADLLVRLYRAIREVSGGSVVVDSSKDPSYAFVLRSIPGLDVRLAHLTRDSRAVAHSWTRRRVRPEIHWRTEYMRTLSPATSARRWVEYNLLFESFRRLPSRSIRVRYEDFAAAPGRHSDRVADLVGLGGHDAATPFEHSISGNPSRFTPLTTIRLDEEWRTAMAHRDRRTVTAITAPLLRAYGYRIAAGRA